MAGDSLNGMGIGDLRRRQPADETMRNLLELTREKLDLCARLTVFELEADNEGHKAAAKLFNELLGVERATFNALRSQLLDEMQAITSDAQSERPSIGSR